MPNMAMYISNFLNYTFYTYAHNNTEYQVCGYLPAVVQQDNGHWSPEPIKQARD